MNKKIIFSLKIPLLVFLFFGVLVPYVNQAQSLKRQCISSYATIVTSEGVTICQTAGQPFGSATMNEYKNQTLIGFQQPIVFRVEKMNPETLKNLKLAIYPNPATYQVAIQAERLIENSNIQVTDLNGKLVMSEKVARLETYHINCENWANGIYIITLSDQDKNRSSLKLIISK